MTVVNIDIVQWDLTVQVRGKSYATVCPTWADVVKLGELEDRLKSQARDPKLEDSLREAISSFLSPVPAQWRFDDLQAVLAAASAYFSEYLKKKQQAATDTATGRQAPPVPAAS